MQPRMKNPAAIIPDAMKVIQALNAATEQGGVPPATLGLVLRIKAELKQRVLVPGRHKDDVTAAAAIASARAAARHELLAPERETPVAAVAGLHQDSYFVDEHKKAARTRKRERPMETVWMFTRRR